jgi:hypothetical protein
VLEHVKVEAVEICGQNEIVIIDPGDLLMLNNGKFTERYSAKLPNITCVATVWSMLNSSDELNDFYSLGVIWFQEDFAFPIDPQVLEKMKHIPFSKVCREYPFP